MPGDKNYNNVYLKLDYSSSPFDFNILDMKSMFICITVFWFTGYVGSIQKQTDEYFIISMTLKFNFQEYF